MDWLIGLLGSGNIDDHDIVTLYFLHEHIIGGQDIDSGLVGVI